MMRHHLLPWIIFMGIVHTSVPAQAQIIPDRTLPTNSVVVPDCVVCTIDGGTASGRNLFHSFDRFSIPTNGSAYFNNAPEIQTIFTRVTGNQISNIDGLVRNNGTASLFLMNPNGIVFGPNASLNLGGSFVGTTANAIGFGKSEVFSASNPEAPPLLTIDPSALIFHSGNTGRIENRSVTPLVNVPDSFDLYGLQVGVGKSIGLVGGEVLMEGGGLSAPGGRIELGGLAEAGAIGLDLKANNLQLTFPSEVLKSNVSLSNKALVSVPLAGGGFVSVNARNLEMSDGSIIRGGIESGLISTRPAGDIVVNASEGIRLVGRITDINNNVRPDSVGNAGEIILNTGSLLLTDGAVLRSTILGKGDSGKITINARDSIVFDKSYLFTGTLATGVGNGGVIEVNTGSIALRNGAAIDIGSAGQGDSGRITIQARGSVEVSGTQANRSYIFSGIDKTGAGTGGDIRITAGSLSIKNGLLYSSILGSTGNASIAGRGNAGNIILNILGNISIDGNVSGLSSALGFRSLGRAGNIIVNAKSLTMNNTGSISNSSFGIGNAGGIDIQIENDILLDNESFMTSSVNTPPGLVNAIGNSGEIRIRSQSLILNQNSFIDTAINGKGNAGNLLINTGKLNLNNSNIGASSLKGGKAGSIEINARDEVVLQGEDSSIASILFSGDGRGGDITINTQNLSLIDSRGISTYTRGSGDAGDVTLNINNRLFVANSLILSIVLPKVSTDRAGNGGGIKIDTGSFLLTDGAQVNASTYGTGKSGDITIDAREFVSVSGNRPSLISVESGSTGLTGDLTINSPRLIVSDKSQISGNSSAVDGGNINLNLGDLLLLRRGGSITTHIPLVAKVVENYNREDI